MGDVEIEIIITLFSTLPQFSSAGASFYIHDLFQHTERLKLLTRLARDCLYRAKDSFLAVATNLIMEMKFSAFFAMAFKDMKRKFFHVNTGVESALVMQDRGEMTFLGVPRPRPNRPMEKSLWLLKSIVQFPCKRRLIMQLVICA